MLPPVAPKTGEMWSDQVRPSVNWNRLQHWGRLFGLLLVVSGLVGTLVYIWLNWGNKTDLVLVKPEAPTAEWLATTPFISAITAESLTGQPNLQVTGTLNLLDPESPDWQALRDDSGVRFGGRMDRAAPGWTGIIIIGRLVDRIDDLHALVGRSRSQAARSRRHPDDFRLS